MVNPLTNHLDITICDGPNDAIAKGFNWSAQTPPVKPIEVKKVVVVRNGMASGKASVDFLLEDETGQRFVFIVTAALLKAIPG